MMQPCVPRRGCRAPCATRFPPPGRAQSGDRDRQDWRPRDHRRGSSEAPPEIRPQPLSSLPRRAWKLPSAARASGLSAFKVCAATNSALARSSVARSGADSLSVGAPASKRDRAQAHAADRIVQQRRYHRPELIRRHAVEHVERGDAHHRVWILKPFPRQADIRRRDVRARARQARRHARRTERWRPPRPRQAALPRQVHRARPHGRPRRKLASPSAEARTNPRSPEPPTRQACPCGSRCRHCSSEACRRDRAVERGSCDRAACRPP